LAQTWWKTVAEAALASNADPVWAADHV